MGSSAVIYTYIPSFIKNGSGVQLLIGWDTQTHTNKHTDTHTHGELCDLISLLYFFKIRIVG
jgi:hypothetical protein